MAKTKTAFNISITTSEHYSARDLAKHLREALPQIPLFYGLPCGRKKVKIEKVTVSPISEK